MKIYLLASVLMLCSCGVAKAPLKPQLVYPVKTIEIAEIEVSGSLLIRRVNPLFLAMGSSGLVADAVVTASNASRYEKRAGPVHQMCLELFEKTLIQSLSEQGFQVNASGRRFWDYFKPSQAVLRQATDGILHIRLQQMGFWSKAIDDGYYPSLMVAVELIDPTSREVLYSDRFSMGVDVTSVKVMDLAYGDTTILPLDKHAVAYKNFNALLNHTERSRSDLLRVMSRAASYISRGLQRPEVPAMLAFDPLLIKSMPAMPRSIDEGRESLQ